MATVRCKNCGDVTHFHNAEPEREKLGWCPACYRQSLRVNRDEETGEEYWWDDNKTISSGLPKHLRAKPPHPTGDST
jgi:NAD-dependent SIR2 family protein deacetylase